MALRLNGLIFDELASDPVSPVDGEMWFNTTENRFKIRQNGTTLTVHDKEEFDLHVADTTNPHQVGLEQARSQNPTLAGPINMGGNEITNMVMVGSPAGTDVVNVDYVADQINQKIAGLDWQDSVLDKDLTTPPGTPAPGDRYIVAAGATGAWAGQDGAIAEWDGSQWVFSTPNEGFATTIEDENTVYLYITSWAPFGSAVDHGQLSGLLDDDHTQYLLVTGSRAMTGNLDMGTNAITNVGLVDGVDVSAHASRHITGGADEIDGDQVDIDFTPTNYTPTTAPPEVTDLDHLSAHLAGIDSQLGTIGATQLEHKAGKVLPGAFSGSPKTATVTFGTAFADADYSVSLIARTTNNTGYNPHLEGAQAAGSFTINLGTGSTVNLTEIQWVATKHGEE